MLKLDVVEGRNVINFAPSCLFHEQMVSLCFPEGNQCNGSSYYLRIQLF